MGKTPIEWTEQTWNPVRGCSPISPGCKRCYAERTAGRFCKEGDPFHGFVQIGKNGVPGPHWTGKMELIPHMLDVPVKCRKPTTWFVNSMSDLFHENLPDEAIDQVFAVMALCPRHTFQVLTKRADRMREYSQRIADGLNVGLASAFCNLRPMPNQDWNWPMPNVWLGVSVEDQQRADERIPHLLQTPAAVRFLSVEPLLGPVDLYRYLPWTDISTPEFNMAPDWVIVGGESGPGARPMNPDWVRRLRDQCEAAGVAFFFKQWGGARKKAAGRLLDGRTWDETPEVRRGV